jgi:hypothetical protein
VGEATGVTTCTTWGVALGVSVRVGEGSGVVVDVDVGVAGVPVGDAAGPPQALARMQRPARIKTR